MQLKKEFIKLKGHQRLYSLDIPIIGLTGGIGSGKTTTAQFFKDLGMPVLNADVLVKEIYKKEESIRFLKGLVPEVLNDLFQINFNLLRELFFSDPELKFKIESFIYPLLKDEFLNQLFKIPNAKFVIYDVPLLFEKQLDKLVDVTLLVYADRDTQIQRILSRDKCSQDIAEAIIAKQIPLEDKKQMAQFVLDNSGDVKNTKEQFDLFILECFDGR